MLTLCGCQEQWGQGEPDKVWLGYFGNSNNSRLDYKQTNIINDHAEIINKLHKVVRNQADKIHALEARPVFDPNECACIETDSTGTIHPFYMEYVTETVPCEVTNEN